MIMTGKYWLQKKKIVLKVITQQIQSFPTKAEQLAAFTACCKHCFHFIIEEMWK